MLDLKARAHELPPSYNTPMVVFCAAGTLHGGRGVHDSPDRQKDVSRVSTALESTPTCALRPRPALTPAAPQECARSRLVPHCVA